MNERLLGSLIILSVLIALGSLICFGVAVSKNSDSPWLTFYIVNPSHCNNAGNTTRNQVTLSNSTVQRLPSTKWFIGLNGVCPQYTNTATSTSCISFTDKRWKAYDALSFNDTSRTQLATGASIWYHQVGSSSNPFAGWVWVSILIPYLYCIYLGCSPYPYTAVDNILIFGGMLYIYSIFCISLGYGWICLVSSSLVHKGSYRHIFPTCQTISIKKTIAFRAYSSSWILSLVSLGILFFICFFYCVYETDDVSDALHPGFDGIKARKKHDKSLNHMMSLANHSVKSVTALIKLIIGLSSTPIIFYHVGDLVLYQWKGYSTWYAACISKCNPDGTYEVTLEIDGQIETGVSPDNLKLDRDAIMKKFTHVTPCPTLSDNYSPAQGAGVVSQETYSPLTNVEEPHDLITMPNKVSPFTIKQLSESNARVFRVPNR